MKNKKGNMFEGILSTLVIILVLVVIVGGIIGISMLFTIPFLVHSTSVDIAYGVESNNFWSKLYLKDDHTTMYCIDDSRLIDIAKNASINKQKVEVTYQEYVFRGTLCRGGEKWSSVVVTDIKVLE